jgi:hypothetical protein
VKVALFDKPSDVKGDLSVITARFYQATEEICSTGALKTPPLPEQRR